MHRLVEFAQAHGLDISIIPLPDIHRYEIMVSSDDGIHIFGMSYDSSYFEDEELTELVCNDITKAFNICV